jgi:heme iron utilization protein
MPYAVDDHGRPIFLISTMAMHTQNLRADPRASVLVMQTDLGASRVTPYDSQKWRRHASSTLQAGGRRCANNENSKYWVDFDDFSLYRMKVVDVYYVGGFGVMGWVDASEYVLANPIRYPTLRPGSWST